MRLSHASSREIMYFHLLPRRIFRRAFPFFRRCWACFSDKAWVLVFFSNVALRSSFKTRRIVVLETPCRRASAIWVGGLSLSVAKSTFLMRSFVRLDGRHCGPSRFNGLGLPWFIQRDSPITRETVILEPVIPDLIRASDIFLQERLFRWWANMAAFVSEEVGEGILDTLSKRKIFFHSTCAKVCLHLWDRVWQKKLLSRNVG